MAPARMSTLRLVVALHDPVVACDWMLGARRGRGQSPAWSGASRVELVLRSADVLLVAAQLPAAARRDTGAALGYAIEDRLAGDPDGDRVVELGRDGAHSTLAAVDRAGIDAWLERLAACGLHEVAVYVETLLLPPPVDGWHLGWRGDEGCVRTGDHAGQWIDAGDAGCAPVALAARLAAARRERRAPTALWLHPVAAAALPDLQVWARTLGLPVHAADAFDPAVVPVDHAPVLWRATPATAAARGGASGVRWALAVVLVALAAHGMLLAWDGWRLRTQVRALESAMTARFRDAFPEAVAVADPAVQMRRQLAQTRAAAGVADPGDFPSLVEAVAAALDPADRARIRALVYEASRLEVAFEPGDAATLSRLAARLTEAGLEVQRAAGAGVLRVAERRW